MSRQIHIAFLGEGCDSQAYEVNGTWVLRFAKRNDVAAQFSIEARILPLLAESLPLPVPRFVFHRDGFVGYRKLPGIPVIRSTLPLQPIAQPLGRFLRALHAFPIDEARRAGVPEASLDELLDEIRDDALGDLDVAAAFAPVDRVETYLRARLPAIPKTPLVLTHHDLAAEHVLVDPATNEPTGVIDWSDVSITQRVTDFAGLFHWGGRPFVDAVLTAYGDTLAGDELEVARYMAVCRGVADIAFGREMGRREYVDGGVRALSLVQR